MDHKKSFWAYYIGSFGSCLVMLLGCSLDTNWIIFGIGLALFFVAILQLSFFYKCPHCDTHLNIRARRPKYCPECGSEIEW